jgi:hypothetical protein
MANYTPSPMATGPDGPAMDSGEGGGGLMDKIPGPKVGGVPVIAILVGAAIIYVAWQWYRAGSNSSAVDTTSADNLNGSGTGAATQNPGVIINNPPPTKRPHKKHPHKKHGKPPPKHHHHTHHHVKPPVHHHKHPQPHREITNPQVRVKAPLQRQTSSDVVSTNSGLIAPSSAPTPPSGIVR